MQHSGALLVYRRRGGSIEFLLAHPGGPYWRSKDIAAWSIPKGLMEPGEDPLSAARREFAEETGTCPGGSFLPLPAVRQKGGKLVSTWLVEADLDLAGFHSNLFELEWPRGSGRVRTYPEVDRLAYMTPAVAMEKILASQRPILTTAFQRLGLGPGQGV